MRGLFRLTVILALLAAGPAAAQSTLDELARASELMQAADKVFRDRKIDQVTAQVLGRAKELPPTDLAVDNAYRQIGESISIFVRAAPSSRIDDALEAAQNAYEGAHLPKPETLLAAAEDCDRRRDPTLARYLTGSLWLQFSLTRANAEAEAKLGPLPDNPAFYTSLRRPVTGIDLLTNLKWVFDQNAWLREDFYTPKTLRTFLSVDLKPQRFVDGSVTNFAVVRPSGSPGQCTFQADRRIKPAGTVSGYLNIRCTYRRADMPTFEEAEQVFGAPVRDRLPRPRSPHAPPLPPATAPHGNETIVYDLGSASMKRGLAITFAPDARFAELSASAEGQ